MMPLEAVAGKSENSGQNLKLQQTYSRYDRCLATKHAQTAVGLTKPRPYRPLGCVFGHKLTLFLNKIDEFTDPSRCAV